MDTFLSSTHSFQRQSQLCKYSGINSCSRQNPLQNFNPKTYIDFFVNLCLIQKLLSQVSYVQMPLDLRAWIGLTHLCHDVYSTCVVWTFQTFENNFGMQHKFTKYLKESCRQCCDEQFSFKYFLNFAFVREIIVRQFWLLRM